MTIPKLPSRIPIFPILIAVSFLVGWSIPEFYAWTDSDQSRPSPLLWKIPLWFAIGSAGFCLALPWLPITRKTSSDALRPPIRFSVRTLLILTAGVAVGIPLLGKYPLAISALVCAGSFALLCSFCVRNRQHCMAATALISCMLLPYAWLVAYDELDRIFPMLAIHFAGMPTFLPAAMISQSMGQHFRDSEWLTFLLTSVEVVMGTWVIHLGPKRAIAYILLAMNVSCLGSLGFYMMCIA